MHKKPLVSVITVCYNSAHLLQRTIKSLRLQTYSEIEYIVIDGASKDNTKQIIKENKLYEITLSYNMILISFGIIPIPLTEKIINLNKPELRKLIISKTIKQAHQLNK